MDIIEPKFYECSICFGTPLLPIADAFITEKPLVKKNEPAAEDKSGLWLSLLCSSCQKEMRERLQSGLGPSFQMIDESDDEDDDEDEDDGDEDDTNSKPVRIRT